jgi:hypothetical protein
MEKTMSDTITIPRKVLASLISQAVGSYPNPDDSMPPGLLDPYIRTALDRMRWGPQPEPWIVADPRPEPWRLAYTTVLTQEIVSSIINLQDLASILPQANVQELASQRLQVFIDDYCGTSPRKPPFPGPRSIDGVNQGFSPLELVAIGTQFETAASTFADEGLRQALSKAGSQLTEQGVAQMGEGAVG